MTTPSGLPRALCILALNALHPRKTLSPKQTGTVGPPVCDKAVIFADILSAQLPPVWHAGIPFTPPHPHLWQGLLF